MNFNKALTTGLGLTMALGLVACGGGPDIDQVKADFANPSGSTKDKNSVMSASGQAGASGSVRSLGASGVPGQSLTATGKLRAFNEVNMLKRYAPVVERDYYRLMKNETRPLRAAQFESDCSGGQANAAAEEIANELALDLVIGGGSASGSASFTMDMSSCTGGRVTGSVEVEMEIEIEETSFRYRVTEKLNNVCETDGEQACLDGTLLLEGEANGDGSGQSGEITFYVAWDVNGTWVENGVTLDASVKGGVRTLFGADAMTAWGSIEYLVYAQNAAGEEFSFVYQLSGEWDGVGGGNGSLKIRGADGTLECTYTATMVSCTGSGDVTWTPEEEAAFTADVYGG